MWTSSLPLLFVALHVVSAQDEACFNAPSQSRAGYCINIHTCPPVLTLLKQKPLRPEVIKQLQASQCGYNGNIPNVCCPSDAVNPNPLPTQLLTTTYRPPINPQQPTIPNVPQQPTGQPVVRVALNHPKLRLLPMDSCGTDASDEKIVNGKRAGLGQFPWMARIGYQTRTGESYRCGGSVISKRYVLTAAHCISHLPPSFAIKSVLLGEHDSEKQVDCEDRQNQRVCMPETQLFGIERVIPHPQYSASNFQNDIALIRLNRDANLTVDSVRPVCLPVGGIQLKNLDQIPWFTVAGWGTTENGSSSTTLLFVNIPPVPVERCKSIYQRQASIVPSQICAGGRSQDSCDGDSGGPLTMPDVVGDDPSPRATQIGVVSFGPTRCGTVNMPGVYTRIGHFLNWIMENIQP